MPKLAGGRGGTPGRTDRLGEITLDEELRRAASADIAHERDVAIYDLIEDNSFRLTGVEGPYRLHLTIRERRLVFDIAAGAEGQGGTIMLSLNPLNRVIRDYFMVCETYYKAIRTDPPSRIEAIDMGRRALHDEGSRALQDRLAGKVEMDFPTARRLFTLICALHWRG